MRAPVQMPKPRKSQLVSFPVPTAGLISNRNLALPVGQGMPPGAAILENWFPTASGVILRRGKRRHATIAGGLDVRSTFKYVLGAQKSLFAAVNTGVWDVTLATPVSVHPGTTDGAWVTLQFSTSNGTTFLIGVNGTDTGWIYDGALFWPYVAGGISSLGVAAVPVLWVAGVTITGGTSGATATIVRTAAGVLRLRGITGTFQMAETLTGSAAGSTTVTALATAYIPGVTGLLSSRMSGVWAYKQRVFFLEKDTLNAWYLPVDQVGGTAVVLPLGGVFSNGGSLLFGQNWSLDSGGAGGLAEQCIFVTTEGEVAAFQGIAPDDVNTWGKVGVYLIGRPLGKRAFIRAGGDLVICTALGFIPLGQAIRRDYAALGQVAVSRPIADDWAAAVTDRGGDGWEAELWGEGKMALVVPPTPADLPPVVFVSNSDTGAWCKFTGWQVSALETFDGQLYLGSTGGAVQQGMFGGIDEDMPYTGSMAPLFNDLGSPANRKFSQFARMVSRATFAFIEKVTARFDWDVSIPTAPDAAVLASASLWDVGLWDVATWNADRATVIQQKQYSVGGSGYAATVVVQVTSGAVAPLDVEIVRADFGYMMGDVVT